MKKILVAFIMAFPLAPPLLSTEIYELRSPDGKLVLEAKVDPELSYSVSYSGKTVLKYSPIGITLQDTAMGGNTTVVNQTTISHTGQIAPAYGTSAIINDQYNELVLELVDGFSVVFRAYDQGAAYRIEIDREEPIPVMNEEVVYRFPGPTEAWIPDGKGYETTWTFGPLAGVGDYKKMPLPLLTIPVPETTLKMAVTEADVQQYPSLLLKKDGASGGQLRGVFDGYPMRTKQGGFMDFIQIVTKAEDHIAMLETRKHTPWRVLIIAENDVDLLHSTLVYQLAPPNQIGPTDWIKPGQVAWDWWHDYKLEDVDFEPGINTDTYLYHIDFAAEYGIPYINIDWKWSDPHDIFKTNPDVDIERIMTYARNKGVRVFVWTLAYTLERQLEEALDYFKELGVAGVKVDFFVRDDQVANDLYPKMAMEAAKRQLLLNFHGCAKPSGLERTYPNIMTYEAVKGLEYSKWRDVITPDHDTHIPFIRQLAGPIDYTPGAMRNRAKGKFKKTNPPVSQGTRAHQMAMYVVYYSPLVMLCDSPTAYEREPEYTSLLTSIPSTWDESKPLAGKVGEYAVVARRNSNAWYIGAITNWQGRDLKVDVSFLPDGVYQATLLVDGRNANKKASSYELNRIRLENPRSLDLRLKQGGGAFVKLERLKE